MIAAARFLRALGDALEARGRERDGAGLRAADMACHERLRELLAEDSDPVFRFSREGLEYGPLVLADLPLWPWSSRLAMRGIERLEFTALPGIGTLAAFLDYAAGLMPAGGIAPRLTPDGLRWGLDLGDSPSTRHPLTEELDVVREIFRGVERGQPVRSGDAMVVATSLAGHVEGTTLLAPLVIVAERDDYQPAHAINTTLLTVAVGEALELPASERAEAALAALLHDIGMTRIPADTLQAPRFSAGEREVLRSHPLEGARLLLRQGERFEPAAIVAYEHHLRKDGSGYPRLSYPREPHKLSQLVAVCDAFDALLAPRADRPAMDPATALRQLERSAVTQFEPEVVSALGAVVLGNSARGSLHLTTR
jgi:HD-GYP domain-containing protein (c-di-GMP phosphodiesterase class II)